MKKLSNSTIYDHSDCFARAKEYEELKKEVDRLRNEENIWKKVCAFEKKKWEAIKSAFPDYEHKISKDNQDHHRNLSELAGE